MHLLYYINKWGSASNTYLPFKYNWLYTMRSGTFLSVLLFTGLVFFILTCSGLFYNPEDVPKSVSWIDIKTGLTDSFEYDDPHITKYQDSFPSYDGYAAFLADIIDSGGFDISWNGVRNADYYEIRVSTEKITASNWDKAALVATVQARPESRMFTSIKRLQPTVRGRNCTKF